MVEIYFYFTRGRKSNKKFTKTLSLELLFSLPLCLSPLFAFPVILTVLEDFIPELAELAAIVFSLIVVLQLITAYLLVEAIQVTKAARFDQAILPVFAVLYASSMMAFLLV